MDRTRRITVLGTIAFLLLTANSPGWASTANEPPVAEAGLPRYAAKDPVRLDGSGSYDPDHSGPLSYAWTQVSGPPVVLTEADTATPTISGFVQTELIQQCEFELTVSDGQDASLPDTVRVVIVPTFTDCTMTLENTVFDPEKPTVVFFGGGKIDGTGGEGPLGIPAWWEKANVISFAHYVSDVAGPIPAAGDQPDRRYEPRRHGHRVPVGRCAGLSSAHPDIGMQPWGPRGPRRCAASEPDLCGCSVCGESRHPPGSERLGCLACRSIIEGSPLC